MNSSSHSASERGKRIAGDGFKFRDAMPLKSKQDAEGKKLLRCKRGRPCLLSPKREAKLLGAIEDGLPLKEAALIAGVSYDTLNRWRVRGESKYAPRRFRHFCKALKRSQAKAMYVLVSRIKRKGKSDWRASAWLLERRHPELYGRPEYIEAKLAEEQKQEEVTHPVLMAMKQQKTLVGVLSKLGHMLRKVKSEDEERERERLLRSQRRGRETVAS